MNNKASCMCKDVSNFKQRYVKMLSSERQFLVKKRQAILKM